MTHYYILLAASTTRPPVKFYVDERQHIATVAVQWLQENPDGLVDVFNGRVTPEDRMGWLVREGDGVAFYGRDIRTFLT